jgi:putative transposase
MPRSARLVIPGLPYHITARGNNRAEIFCSDRDRITYLELLKQYALPAGMTILGYCLMTNHIHMIAIPARKIRGQRGC